MKKILVIIMALFILTGCSTVDKTTIVENSVKPAEHVQKQVYNPEPKTEIVNKVEITGTTPVETIVIQPPKPQEISVPPEQPKEKKQVPILYYHAINDTVEGIEELFVKPKEFEKQMEFLKKNNYTVITFDQLSDVKNINNPVLITFDDGYEDNYLYAYPVLKKYNYKATIFLCTDFIDNPSILKKNQIKEMLDLISFQSHTLTHPYLTRIKAEDAEKELSDSKKIIEDLTGKKVDVLAYPIGDYDQKVINLTQKYYKYAVVNAGGIYTEGDSNYEVKRVYIPRNLDISGFERKIKVIR